jgi:hypothetical protein
VLANFGSPSEPMKNACQNAARLHFFDRPAVLFRVDMPRHCLTGFITEETDRKFPGVPANEDCGALDPVHDDGDGRSNRIQYLTGEAHSARRHVFDIEEVRPISELDHCLFVRAESFIEAMSWLLDAGETTNRQDEEICTRPKTR